MINNIKSIHIDQNIDFLELAEKRYSCRSFSTKEIEMEKIEKILKAAKLAPTARNLQPQRILVLTEKEQLEKLNGCTQYGWNAPLVMILFYDKNVSYKRDTYDYKEFGDIDTSIVATHMLLEIQNLGLGTTWIGSFDPKKLVEIYDIPENLIPVAILPIGYPSEKAKPSKLHFERKQISDFTYWNKIQ